MKILVFILYFILATIITAVLPFSGLFMPLILVLSAALFVALSVKWNYIYSIFSAAFSGLLIYFILDFDVATTTGIIYSAIFPLIPFISATGIFVTLKTKASVKTVLLSGTIAYFLLIGTVYFLYGGTFIADAINVIKNVMFESLDSVFQSIPADSADIINELRQTYEIYFETLKVIAPSIILSLFFLISYFTIKVSERLSKDKTLFEMIPPFSELRAPAFLLVVAAISYAAQMAENGFLSGLMANVFMGLSVYYTLCGFSLIDFFTKLRIKKLSARIAIYIAGIFVLMIISFVFYFASPVLIAMFGGIIDSFFNYRAKVRMIKGK